MESVACGQPHPPGMPLFSSSRVTPSASDVHGPDSTIPSSTALSTGGKILGAGLVLAAKASVAVSQVKTEAALTVVKQGGAAVGRLVEEGYNKLGEERQEKIQAFGAQAEANAKVVAKSAGTVAAGVVEGAKATKAATESAVAQARREAFDNLPDEAKVQLDKNAKWVDDKLEQAKAKAASVASPFTDKLFGAVRTRVRRGLTNIDSEAPACVRGLEGAVFDEVWPHVEIEIRSAVDNKFRKREADEGKADEGKAAAAAAAAVHNPCCPWPRAFILYHWSPFDRGFWGRLRDPWHVVMRVLTLFPMFGVRSLFFAVILLLVLWDPSRQGPDEYQLVRFILGFKALHCISAGVLATLIAVPQFLRCVNLHVKDEDHNHGPVHNCHLTGPGAAGYLSTDMFLALDLGGFVLNSVLVWMALLALRGCSFRHGKRRARFLMDKEKKNDQAKEAAEAAAEGGCCCCCVWGAGRNRGGAGRSNGGALRGLLWWDLLAFLLCVGVLLLLSWQSETGPWDLTPNATGEALQP